MKKYTRIVLAQYLVPQTNLYTNILGLFPT